MPFVSYARMSSARLVEVFLGAMIALLALAGLYLALTELYQWFSTVALGLVFCSLALGGVLSWHNRLLIRANAKVQRTTGELQRVAADLAAAHAAIAGANSELRFQNRLLVEKEDALQSQNALFDAA